jgi:hypothetical protein
MKDMNGSSDEDADGSDESPKKDSKEDEDVVIEGDSPMNG